MHIALAKLVESMSEKSPDLPGYTGKILLDLDTVEELANLSSQLLELGRHITSSCQHLEVAVAKTANVSFESLREDLRNIGREVKAGKQYLAKKAACISIVINEFRQRCRDELIDHLKEMDLELRKIIKPLVPNKILEENIKYRPINTNPSLLNSMASSLKSAKEDDKPSDTKSSDEQAGGHLQMLVGTLETVAKDLINMIFTVDHKYYELVDPAELNSGPPTPLAAPLPEYFSFKFDDETKDSPVDNHSFTLSEEAKKKILAKFVDFQRDPEQLARKLNKNSLVLIKRLLRKVPAGQLPTEDDLELLLNDRFLSIVDKEDLVFDLISSGTFDDSAISKSSEAILSHDNESRFHRKLELQDKTRQLKKQSTPAADKTYSEGRKSVYDKRYSLPETKGIPRMKSDLSEVSPKPEAYDARSKAANKILAYHSESKKVPSIGDEDSRGTPISVKRRMSPIGDHSQVSKIFRKPTRNLSPEVDSAYRSSNLSKAYSASKISSRNPRDIRVRSVTPVFGQETKTKKQRTPQSRGQRKKALALI
jgi:hypothetical protein